MAAEPIPFSEPPWLNGHPSPYYNTSHKEWQTFCRKFMQESYAPYAMQWENEGAVPEHVYGQWGKAGMLIPSLPSPLPVPWLKRLDIHAIGPVKVEDFDYTHTSIYIQETMRTGIGGPKSALTAGLSYGLPPILKFGSEELKERFVPGILRGEVRVCIAITEPDAGSDVAGVTTTAVKSPDGKKYVVNGTKKWITNGIWSDYASMCVRTGGPGPEGLSILLVPLKGAKGVNMRRLAIGGPKSSGTTFIELDDVEVPAENLIGQEGMGMKYIMLNFNHERLTIAISVTCQARAALAAAFEYVMRRQAFGKKLIEQPVVRHRLAKAGAELETQWAWVESFVYQMCKLPKEVADTKLGGLTALCKAKAAMVLNECAQTAQLLFGGNGYTQSGQGELVEKIMRDVPGARIPGGSEDVMLDLAVRQLYKNYQRGSKAKM